MSNLDMDRREFLKNVGLGTAFLGMGLASPRVLARTVDGYVVESESEYGELPVERLSGNKKPYQYNPEVLKQMEERMNMFSRNVWDPKRQDRPRENSMYKNLVEGEGKVVNQSRLDYALMAAAWSLANFRGSPCYKWESQSGQIKMMSKENMGRWNPADLDMNWEDASQCVKHAGLFYGASLAGVAKLNPLWVYSENFSPPESSSKISIPDVMEGERMKPESDQVIQASTMTHVVALAFEEDYQAIANSPGRLASAATGNGYSRMAFTAFCLAEFIRALGYEAIPAGNGVGLSIPIAIDAGLGELGRNGLLVTPKYGPRVRLAKILTNMPLVPDSPIRFGVTEFCETCKLCADECPSRSISTDTRTWEGKSKSNNPGSFKWYIYPESCYDFNGFSCSNCKMSCPFNKPNNSWLHKAIRGAINMKTKSLDNLMVKFDQASGYGKQVPDKEFWKTGGDQSITARDPKV